jgi:hypothetical protein
MSFDVSAAAAAAVVVVLVVVAGDAVAVKDMPVNVLLDNCCGHDGNTGIPAELVRSIQRRGHLYVAHYSVKCHALSRLAIEA